MAAQCRFDLQFVSLVETSDGRMKYGSMFNVLSPKKAFKTAEKLYKEGAICTLFEFYWAYVQLRGVFDFLAKAADIYRGAVLDKPELCRTFWNEPFITVGLSVKGPYGGCISRNLVMIQCPGSVVIEGKRSADVSGLGCYSNLCVPNVFSSSGPTPTTTIIHHRCTIHFGSDWAFKSIEDLRASVNNAIANVAHAKASFPCETTLTNQAMRGEDPATKAVVYLVHFNHPQTFQHIKELLRLCEAIQ
ncbi:hypothetical protein HDV05_008558, partial [Chytridiales sp. JEL 0842]